MSVRLALAGAFLMAIVRDRARALGAHAEIDPPRIDLDALSKLPDPARRFLLAAIRPGTPLRTVAEITMHGKLSLGTKEAPGYRPMRACQMLAAPHGFIWQVP